MRKKEVPAKKKLVAEMTFKNGGAPVTYNLFVTPDGLRIVDLRHKDDPDSWEEVVSLDQYVEGWVSRRSGDIEFSLREPSSPNADPVRFDVSVHGLGLYRAHVRQLNLEHAGGMNVRFVQ